MVCKIREESEFLTKVRTLAENKIINGAFKLREQLIKAKNQKMNSRDGLRNKNKEESNTNKFIGIKEMIDFIGIDNYYEFFLGKEYIRDINLNDIKMNEFNSYLSLLNKINKKKIAAKFDDWLNLSPEEKEVIKNEFNSYVTNTIQL